MDVVARIAHAATAAHHRLQVGHEEGNVVERIVVADAQRHAVMVAVAAHEGHDAGAIRQGEVEHVFHEGLGEGHIMGVQHRMGQSLGAVGHAGGLGSQAVAMHDFKNAAIGIGDLHRDATARVCGLAGGLKHTPSVTNG